jgi:bifunctional DNA-binding transcriptional regulator/antitoxin component of YhaV-PrlF toxin-antitoxin module
MVSYLGERKVVKRAGSLQVTLLPEAAEYLNIKSGDYLMFFKQKGKVFVENSSRITASYDLMQSLGLTPDDIIRISTDTKLKEKIKKEIDERRKTSKSTSTTSDSQ